MGVTVFLQQPHGSSWYTWLVSCLARAGEIDRAQALFEQLAGYANDLGLLAEEIDPEHGEQLGNFPQAFSHIGLINTARNLSRTGGPAEDRRKQSSQPLTWASTSPVRSSPEEPRR